MKTATKETKMFEFSGTMSGNGVEKGEFSLRIPVLKTIDGRKNKIRFEFDDIPEWFNTMANSLYDEPFIFNITNPRSKFGHIVNVYKVFVRTEGLKILTDSNDEQLFNRFVGFVYEYLMYNGNHDAAWDAIEPMKFNGGYSEQYACSKLSTMFLLTIWQNKDFFLDPFNLVIRSNAPLITKLRVCSKLDPVRTEIMRLKAHAFGLEPCLALNCPLADAGISSDGLVYYKCGHEQGERGEACPDNLRLQRKLFNPDNVEDFGYYQRVS